VLELKLDNHFSLLDVKINTLKSLLKLSEEVKINSLVNKESLFHKCGDSLE